MKTYQFEEALNAINEANSEHLTILCFYQKIKVVLCQNKLSDTRILELFELSKEPYFNNSGDFVSCLSKFNNGRIVDLETINLKELEKYAKQWSPYQKVNVVIDEND